MSIRYAPEKVKTVKSTIDEKTARLANMPEKQYQAELSRARGRPKTTNETITLRVDSDIVAFFKTYGDDWKAEMIASLRETACL